MPPDFQRNLLNTPLRSLDFDLLENWNSTAGIHVKVSFEHHGVIDQQWPDEVRYFLPRLLEAIALGKEPLYFGIAHTFATLSLANWQEWLEKERRLLTDFAEMFFVSYLRRNPRFPRSVTTVADSESEAVSAAVSLLILGIPFNRVITLWQRMPDPLGALHIAEARVRDPLSPNRHRDGDLSYYLAKYQNKMEAIGEPLADWLGSPENDARLEAAFFSVEDTDPFADQMQHLISEGLKASF